ncbi:hypothetical protein DFH09DRAFT_1095089 [Mycena vulgaris]|nr:hypothetical protein DFH09DRAFT_1095089 [Mycena vulgaris]
MPRQWYGLSKFQTLYIRCGLNGRSRNKDGGRNWDTERENCLFVLLIRDICHKDSHCLNGKFGKTTAVTGLKGSATVLGNLAFVFISVKESNSAERKSKGTLTKLARRHGLPLLLTVRMIALSSKKAAVLGTRVRHPAPKRALSSHDTSGDPGIEILPSHDDADPATQPIHAPCDDEGSPPISATRKRAKRNTERAGSSAKTPPLPHRDSVDPRRSASPLPAPSLTGRGADLSTSCGHPYPSATSLERRRRHSGSGLSLCTLRRTFHASIVTEKKDEAVTTLKDSATSSAYSKGDHIE